MAGAAVRADLQAKQADELEQATAGLEADAGGARRGARGRRAGRRRRRRCRRTRRRRAATAPRPAPRHWSARWRTCRAPAGASCCATSTASWARCVDLVEIDDGWDGAFEAAIGAGVAAVVVDGRRSAQAALATLRDGGVTGAVLAPRPSSAPGVGELPPGSSAEPVRRHVRARRGGSVAESVLDTLVGRAVRVDGWEEAIDLSLARDDLVVVTPEGDRFAATGWRVRSTTSVVTAASVEEARRRAAEAAATAELARAHLSESRIVLGRCRDARTAAERAADRHASACETGRADRERSAEEQRRLAGELDEARGRGGGGAAGVWPR